MKNKHISRRAVSCLLSCLMVTAVPNPVFQETTVFAEENPIVCICVEKCTEYSINADCPVCGIENADLNQCIWTEQADIIANSVDEAVKSVQTQIDALPTAAELANMSLE